MARKKPSTTSGLPDFVVVKDSEGNTGSTPDPRDQAEPPSEVVVRLDGGGDIRVPATLLERKKLGSGYHFRGRFADYYGARAEAGGQAPARPAAPDATPARAAAARREGTPAPAQDALVVPVLEEQLRVGRKQVETGKVRIRKVVHERREVIDEPVFGEDVEVTRVPVDRAVDGPPPVRMEGDVMIIPLLEERVVTQKQLFLREELHVTKRRYETTSAQEVTVRSEEAVVEQAEPREERPADKQARRRGAGR